MGRTLPSITMAFMQEQEAFSRFRRALRRSDQLALDDLFAMARKHLAPAAYAAHALPMETFLLAMLLEEHKEVMRLRQLLKTRTARILMQATGWLLDLYEHDRQSVVLWLDCGRWLTTAPASVLLYYILCGRPQTRLHDWCISAFSTYQLTLGGRKGATCFKNSV